MTTVQADVASVDGRDHLVQEIHSWLGSKPKLDILVNNVGTNIRKPSIEYTQDDIDTVFKTNFFSMFALTVALHPGEYSRFFLFLLRLFLVCIVILIQLSVIFVTHSLSPEAEKRRIFQLSH